MKFSLILGLSLVLLVQGKPMQGEQRDFVNSMVLGDKMSVSWEVYYSTQIVLFEVTAVATGWVGFGMSSQANMYNGDLIMGGVNDADDTPYFTDRHSNGPGRPAEDSSQDWTLLQSSQDNGTTTLKFFRKFDTGDEADDLILEDNDTWFIWALGPNDDTTQYHVADRGNALVNILKDPNSE